MNDDFMVTVAVFLRKDSAEKHPVKGRAKSRNTMTERLDNRTMIDETDIG